MFSPQAIRQRHAPPCHGTWGSGKAARFANYIAITGHGGWGLGDGDGGWDRESFYASLVVRTGISSPNQPVEQCSNMESDACQRVKTEILRVCYNRFGTDLVQSPICN